MNARAVRDSCNERLPQVDDPHIVTDERQIR